MLIRPYIADDAEAVKTLHQAQGLAYELPDLEAPSMLDSIEAESPDLAKCLAARPRIRKRLNDALRPFPVRAVVEEEGQITHAVFLRKTSEAYWIFSPAESKRERLGKLLAISRELVRPADRAGIEDVHAFIPPQVIDVKLDRTLLNLGWVKPLWTCYTRRVNS